MTSVSRAPVSRFSASAAAWLTRPEGTARVTSPVPTSSIGSLYGRMPVHSKHGAWYAHCAPLRRDTTLSATQDKSDGLSHAA